MTEGHLLTVANLILLLLLVCQVKPSTGSNPYVYDCGPDQRCKCNKVALKMMCTGLYLKSFDVDPAQDWSWVEYLNFQQNEFQTVPDLRIFTSLRHLMLMDSNITKLEKNSFFGLENLENLDLTYLKLSFNTGSIHNQTFKPLTKLQKLSIKQLNPVVGPGIEDYSFLLPVKDTLQQLFMVGSRNLPRIFNEEFPRLNYLSLGGINCNLSSFPHGGFTNLHKSPLNKLSMRACNIKTIPSDFFKPLAKSLVRLDISCNPLHEALENIAQSLLEGNLKVLVADYINHKAQPCGWNVTSEFILPSLEAISLRYNHINYFTLGDNNTKAMKNLKSFDISYNSFHGAGLNIFTTKCDYLFSCNRAALHQLQFIGISAITSPDYQSCGDGMRECGSEDHRISQEQPFPPQVPVKHPEYLDAFIVKDFFKEIIKTAQADMKTFINTHRNISSLASYSIMRILLESIDKHPDTNVIINNVINITIEASSEIEALRGLAKYLCRNQFVQEIYKDTMRTWVRLPSAHYTTWSDKAIDQTISHICNQSDWQYGVNFLTNKRFHWLLTNLTLVDASRINGDLLNIPNNFCNDAVYFPNNLRHIDLSLSHIPHIACSNISGMDTLGMLECKDCRNTGWDFTASDFPALYHLNWPGNYIGHLIREGNLFKGFSKLQIINLQSQQDGIKYFMRNDTFSDQRYLLHLELDENGIETWNISLKNHNYIEYLDLRKNKITYIEKKFQLDLDQVYNIRKTNLSVHLAGNPITCSCSPKILEFVKWLIHAEVIADRHLVKCGDNRPLTKLLKECAQHRNVGWPTSTIIIVCTSAAVALLGFVAVGLVVKRQIRWRRVAGYEQLPDGRLPTAFISFPQSMTDEVKALKDMTHDQLILLSSVWDFFEGVAISSNLSVILAETKMFILVITPDYFNEEGASKEFRLMQNAGLLQREKVLLILTSANVVVNKLPGILQEMYDAGEFLIWPLGVCAGIEFKEMADKIIEKISE